MESSKGASSALSTTGGAGMRQRVLELEQQFEESRMVMEDMRKLLAGVNKTQSEQRSALELMRREMDGRFQSDLDKLLASADQKFNVQSSENKNFQFQLQSQKRVSSDIKDSYDLLMRRVESVEQEIQS